MPPPCVGSGLVVRRDGVELSRGCRGILQMVRARITVGGIRPPDEATPIPIRCC
jgi:hypothetical protein